MCVCVCVMLGGRSTLIGVSSVLHGFSEARGEHATPNFSFVDNPVRTTSAEPQREPSSLPKGSPCRRAAPWKADGHCLFRPFLHSSSTVPMMPGPTDVRCVPQTKLLAHTRLFSL